MRMEQQNTDYTGSVTLVGSVHVSKETRNRVLSTIADTQPDVVAIELDTERLNELFDKAADGEHEQDDQDMIRQLLKTQQENMLDGEDVLPAGEADMLPAVNAATEQGAKVALIDMDFNELKEEIKQDIGIDVVQDAVEDLRNNPDTATLFEVINRARREDVGLEILKRDNPVEAVMNLQEKVGPMKETIQSDDSTISAFEDMSAEELSEMTDAYGEVLPEVIDNLIGQRDAHMAGRLHWLRTNGYDTTTVMGRGHIAGVRKYLENPDTIPEEFVTEPDWYDYKTVPINA